MNIAYSFWLGFLPGLCGHKTEESDAIAAVAMAAYQKIGEGIALLDECPEVSEINEAEAERLRLHYSAAAEPKTNAARSLLACSS